MTEEEAAEWQERLRAAVAATLRARAARKAFRDDHTERRKHGKAALHRIKLARLRNSPQTTEETP